MSTPNELFEQYKQAGAQKRWREHHADWKLQQFNAIFRYVPEPYLILLSPKSKRPLEGYMWSERSLSKDEAIYYIGAGYNVGIVAGFSRPKLCILDQDDSSHYDSWQTLTSKTPRGLQYFFIDDFDDRPRLVEWARKKGYDLPRTGITYVLIPPSQTCINDSKKHECIKHEYRLRYWLREKPLMKISEVVK